MPGAAGRVGAPVSGGALGTQYVRRVLEDSRFMNNAAVSGPAPNGGTADGGAIYVSPAPSLEVSRCHFHSKSSNSRFWRFLSW